MKTLILHGWGGSEFPHWQSYLASELAKDYGTVSFPLLRDKEWPKKEEWLAQVKEHLKNFAPDTVVCHSLANTVWFHLCNEGALKNVKKLFLVAPPSLTCKIPELASFFPVDVPQKLYADEVTLITSTNDKYMDQTEAQELAKALNVTHVVLKEAGHINTDSGYGAWKEIVEWVKGES